MGHVNNGPIKDRGVSSELATTASYALLSETTGVSEIIRIHYTFMW